MQHPRPKDHNLMFNCNKKPQISVGLNINVPYSSSLNMWMNGV